MIRLATFQAAAILSLCACSESRAPDAVTVVKSDDETAAAAAEVRRGAEARGSARFDADMRWLAAEEKKHRGTEVPAKVK